jgi:hypothetical protein
MTFLNPRTAKSCASTLKEIQMTNDTQQDLFDEVIGTFTPEPIQHKRIPRVPEAFTALPKRITIKKRKVPKVKIQAPTTEKVRPIFVRAVEDALTTLRKLGCVYHAQFNGKDYVNGELVEVKKKRSSYKTNTYGERAEHYKPLIENMKAGDVVDVPFAHFEPNELQSSICAYAVLNWGTKACTTSMNKKTKAVEVLRLK